MRQLTNNRPTKVISAFFTAVFLLTILPWCTASVVYSSLLKGEQGDAGNTLTWSTASESNCDFFLLEKSMDGIFFERVAILKAGGTTDQQRHYHYTDSLEKSKRTFYRILQVDDDGRGAYSHMVVLSDKEENAPFQLDYLGNSTTPGNFLLSLSAREAGTLSYRLLSQLGEIKRKGEVQLDAGVNLTSLDFTGIEVGTYQLALKVKNDIEVIALRKVDSNKVPMVNLAIKDKK